MNLWISIAITFAVCGVVVVWLLNRMKNVHQIGKDGTCPTCGSDDLFLLEKINDFDTLVEVYECKECHKTAIKEH